MNEKIGLILDITQDAITLLDEVRAERDDLLEEIEWLNCQLEVERGKQQLNAVLIDLIKDAKFIGSIKLYRERTGTDLRTAKSYCERLRDEVLTGKHGPIDENLYWYLRS